MSNSSVRVRSEVLVNWIAHDKLNFLVKNDSRFGTVKFVIQSIPKLFLVKIVSSI